MRAGLKVEQEVIGDGPVAEVGDRVTVRLEIRLNRGELVQSLDDYTFVIGKRDVIAALEYTRRGRSAG